MSKTSDRPLDFDSLGFVAELRVYSSGLFTATHNERLLVPESPETILEDGLLLLVARGIEDPAVVARSRHLVPELLDSSHVELDSGKHNPDDLVEMRELSAECEMSCQLTVILLQGNMLYDQLPVLENYPFNLEVCSPTFSRQRNPWYPEGKRFGSLQTRPPGPPTE